MNNITTKKLITASAGTGKTYRLSLEFVTLILKYSQIENFDFSNIAVMTFTKKATAELKNKILEFLKDISENGDKCRQLVCDIKDNCGYEVQDIDIKLVKEKILPEMLIHKEKIQVTTIDSFITNIFRNMIIPYKRIRDFVVDETCKGELNPQLFDYLFSADVFPLFEPLLNSFNLRTTENIEGFINSLMENRWLLFYLSNPDFQKRYPYFNSIFIENLDSKKELLWDEIVNKFSILINEIRIMQLEDPKYASKLFDKIIKKDFQKLFDYQRINSCKIGSEVEDAVKNSIQDRKYFMKNIKMFCCDELDMFKLGTAKSTIFKPYIKDVKAGKLNDIKKMIIKLYFYEEMVPLQSKVVSIWSLLDDYYDKLKFSSGRFTYNEVTFYTLKFLHDAKISIVDNDSVTNQFYEQLAYRIHFLLIDEFQDTSVNQYKILAPIINELIAGENMHDFSGVIIVGDKKQSIYGWRGGEQGITDLMEKTLGKPESLDTCYRSKPVILDLINSIFAQGKCVDNFLKSIYPQWEYKQVKAVEDKTPSEEVKLVEKNSRLFYQEVNTYTPRGTEPISAPQIFAKRIYQLIQEHKIKASETMILVRKHKVANDLVDAFNDLNIKTNYRQSSSLFEHKIIKVILSAMKFRLWQDKYSLLEFLRSDVVGIDSQTLLAYLKLFHNTNESKGKDGTISISIDNEMKLRTQPIFNDYVDFADFCVTDFSSESEFVRKLIDKYDFGCMCKVPSDKKNIFSFIELLVSYEMNQRNGVTLDLYGFIEYCQENNDRNSDIKQLNTETNDSINIMTVHESKGLGAENVFVYWKLDNRRLNIGEKRFDFLYSINKENYKDLEDFLIISSSMQHKVLKYLDGCNLGIEELKNKQVDVADVLYVALTRAKISLGLFVEFSKKDGYESMLADLKEETIVAGKIIDSYRNFGLQKMVKNEESILWEIEQCYYEKIEASKTITNEVEIPSVIEQFFTIYQGKEYIENSDYEFDKGSYLNDRKALIGDIAHYYLSFIKWNDIEEKIIAKKMLFEEYGTLLQIDEINKIIFSCQKFIEQNNWIYDKKWNKIFNEKTVFTPSEKRIDRLMIDSVGKNVFIIDYKTGAVHDKNQIIEYQDIIKSLEYFQKNNYSIKSAYKEVKIIDMFESK